MEFDGAESGRILDLTTGINIVPDYLPFPKCSTPDECQGVLK